MSQIDPEREKERLRGVYSEMNDEELLEIGTNPDELAEYAKEILATEAKKRGFTWPLETKEGEGRSSPIENETEEVADIVETEEMTFENMKIGGDKPVILGKYRDMPQAYADKSALESAGIQCFLWNANLVRMDWLWSNLLDGIKLVVRESDAEDAARILDAKVDEDFGSL